LFSKAATVEINSTGLVDGCLRTSPKASVDSLKHHQHLLFDGTFLHKPISIVTLMDGETNTVIAGKYGVEENSN
jgi:hypothetical protein